MAIKSNYNKYNYLDPYLPVCLPFCINFRDGMMKRYAKKRSYPKKKNPKYTKSSRQSPVIFWLMTRHLATFSDTDQTLEGFSPELFFLKKNGPLVSFPPSKGFTLEPGFTQGLRLYLKPIKLNKILFDPRLTSR